MSRLEEWTDALCVELGLDHDEAVQKAVLDLARVVAHTRALALGLSLGQTH